jgi:hypothetical protein
MICLADKRSDRCQHGWQLKPIGQGLAIGGGRRRGRGCHLVHCLNEARQPDGTRLDGWLGSTHWVFRSTTVNCPHVQTGSPHRGRKPATAVTLPRGQPAADAPAVTLGSPPERVGSVVGRRSISGWVRRLLRPWLPAACFSPATACRTSRANFRPRRMLACSGPVSNAISLNSSGAAFESRYESFPRLGSNADSSFRAQKSPGRCRGFGLSKIQRGEISTEIYPN